MSRDERSSALDYSAMGVSDGRGRLFTVYDAAVKPKAAAQVTRAARVLAELEARGEVVRVVSGIVPLFSLAGAVGGGCRLCERARREQEAGGA